MKFGELEVKNFLTLANARVNLKDRGLQLIQGANDDDGSAISNGAGKSSLVDAICWVLFGQTARGVKGDAVVNLAAKKDCCVTLFVENGASSYRVTRYRKHHEGKNSLMVEAKSPVEGEVSIDLSRGTDAETQKVLEKILGCSYEVFMAAVYSGQEIMPDLPRMKDRELKQLIEEAAGMQRIEKAYEEARERFNVVKNEVGKREMRLDSCQHELDRAKVTHEASEEGYAKWEEERAWRVSEAETACIRAAIELRTAVSQEAAAKGPAELAGKRIAEIELALANHRTLEAEARTADGAVRTAELAVDASSLKRLATQVKHYETLITNAATEVKVPCSECGTVTESMTVEEFVRHRTEHLGHAKADLAAGMTKARAQMTEVARLKAVAATAHAKVPDVSALSAEHKAALMRVSGHATTASALSRCGMDEAAAVSALTLRKAEPNPHAVALKACEDRLKEALASLAATTVSLDESRKRLEVAAAVVKVFGPAGVRAQILDTVTPFLNDRTADYLSALSDGEITATWTTLTKSAAGELKEKFSLDVEHKKGGDSFLALSGGEKRKVRLATALALQDLVASRAANAIDLFIGDEIDDALDSAGLERLMGLLERKARERGTVIVISHSDIRDWCDEVTTVRKTGQWHSIVEGSLTCS